MHTKNTEYTKQSKWTEREKQRSPSKSPKKSRKYRKMNQRKEKENNWVLDCINEEKSKLKPYTPLQDQYLKYFLVGVVKRKRHITSRRAQKKSNYLEKDQFTNFLNSKKEELSNSKLPQINQNQGNNKKLEAL